MTSRLTSVPYRLAQFRSSLRAKPSSVDCTWVDSVLPRAERELFYRMPAFDQMHSVLVAREVERGGGDHLLLRAALLHDCGKTLAAHRIPLLYRGVVVVLHALSPALLRALARPRGPLWPVYLHVHHPELGARELLRVGSPPALAELVHAHQEPTNDPCLQRLQRADSRH